MAIAAETGRSSSRAPRSVRAAAIYARISDDRDGERLGVARQEQDCRDLARRKGWPVAGVYIDNDVSAYAGKTRPEYRRLLEDLGRGLVDAVIVWHLDRLHRHPRELEEFFDVVSRAGVRHLASVTGDVDLSTADGQFQARILGAVARKESDDKGRRIRRKHEELAAAGKFSGGGTRAFGYEDGGRAIRATEAKVIREGARMLLEGRSLRSVVRAWSDAGATTSTGRSWYTSAVHRVLMSGRIAGMREHHGEVVGKAEWPAIISAEDSTRLRAILGDPRRRTNEGARRYLLTGGFLRCALCGSKLHARPRADKSRCYVCASGPGFGGCGKIRRLAEPVEDLITEMLFEAIDGRELAKRVAARSRATLRTQSAGVEDVGAIEKQLEQLAVEWGAGRLTRREWTAARSTLNARRDAARSSLSRRDATAPVREFIGRGGALRRAWPTLDLDRQRAIIGVVLDHIRVLPATRGLNRFDPTRFEPVWKV